jgi:signal transduction histidine kinase/DNA-binding LytR/AlgR family response regulator
MTALATLQSLLFLLMSAAVGVGVGVSLCSMRNSKKYRGSSKALELCQRLENAERRYQAELASREASHAFFANMSHELRTPFQGLMGMLELVRDSPLNDAQLAHVDTAQRSAHHLLGVLNAILDVSSMDSGMFQLTLAPMSIREVLTDAEALMVVEARKKGLALNVHLAKDLPDWVIGDALRVRQIGFNLISNALKFTDSGSITMRARCSKSRPGSIVLSVQDTGAGMDKATEGQLFTRFFQANNTKLRRTGGTGLGLEISRNLARLMDGDIHVASELGVGTTFTVLLSLPACEPSAEELKSAFIELESVDPLVPETALRFLVAEDHPINRQYMIHLLLSKGHLVNSCDNGRDALTLAQSVHFDVILLDYHMPEMDGMEVTRRIRRGPEPYSNVKILMLTADTVNDTRQLANEAGVTAFMTKPLSKSGLRRALVACGVYKNTNSRNTRLATHPQFVMSDYELPICVDVPASNTSSAEAILVDWPAMREVIEVMPHETIRVQLQSLFHPLRGAITECLNTVTQQTAKKQLKMVHDLKGSLSLLGLGALATCCESAQVRLKRDPPKLLDQPWVDELTQTTQRTLEELKTQFQLDF